MVRGGALFAMGGGGVQVHLRLYRYQTINNTYVRHPNLLRARVKLRSGIINVFKANHELSEMTLFIALTIRYISMDKKLLLKTRR